MGTSGAVTACPGRQCTALLLMLAVLVIAATLPTVQAHPKTLLKVTQAPTGSSSSSSSGTGVASPSKPVRSLNSKLQKLPWRQQPQQPAGPSGMKPQTTGTELSKQGKGMRSGFGNGQPAAEKLPKALHMEQPFHGLDPHGPFPDVPVPAAGQQPAYQKAVNVPKDFPKGSADMKRPLLQMQGKSGQTIQQLSRVIAQPDLASAKRNLLQYDDGKPSDQKDMPSGALANSSNTAPALDTTLDLTQNTQHADGKHGKKLQKPDGLEGLQVGMANPSMPPAGHLPADPKLRQLKPHHHANGGHDQGHSNAKPAHMQPGEANTGLLSLGHPSMRSPGYTIAHAEEQQQHTGDDRRSSNNMVMRIKTKSSNGEEKPSPPMRNPSMPPQAAVAPDAARDKHHQSKQFGPVKGHDGVHVPMRNLQGGVLTIVPPTRPSGHEASAKHGQPHHKRNLLADTDAASSTPPQELPAADSALTQTRAESESHRDVAKASQSTAATSTENKAHTLKKDGLLGDRIAYVKSASGLPAIKIDFRSKAAREKQPSPDEVSATEVARKTGSPNANLLEGFQPMPIIDPGMLAAMLSGPPGIAGQWGPAWGR